LFAKRSMGSTLMSPEDRAMFDSSLKAGGWQGVWEKLQPGQVRHRLTPCSAMLTCSIDWQVARASASHASLAQAQAFDEGRMSPVVSKKLQSGELDVKGKTCLVPGCG
jgi:hypothetical protein